MGQEIYTLMYSPFTMGGSLWKKVKTTVEEYEVIKLGNDITGILIKNPFKKLWHCAEPTSGAIVGTNKSKSNLIRQVKNDIKQGDKIVMAKQIEDGKCDCKNASFMNQNEFFKKIDGIM